MGRHFTIAFFGSSLVSAYWNGAATYYRGIIRALHERGHRVTFYEPDIYDRQAHRDMADPEWARVIVYQKEDVYAALESASGADVVVKASGIGVNDELLEREVLSLRRPNTAVVFWDVDAPATLEFACLQRPCASAPTGPGPEPWVGRSTRACARLVPVPLQLGAMTVSSFRRTVRER